MKRLLYTLLAVSIIYSSCKKEEDNEEVIEQISLNNAWHLNVENTFLEAGIYGGNYIDDETNIIYNQNVNESFFISKLMVALFCSGQRTANAKSRINLLLN